MDKIERQNPQRISNDPTVVVRVPALATLMLMVILLGACDSSKGRQGKRFDAARETMMRGDFDSATEQLQSFLRENPSHALASRATFLVAKSEMGRGDFGAAKEWFSKTVDKFPSSEEAHKARFKLAMIALLQNENQHAVARLQELVQSADGPYTPEARAWLTHLQELELAPQGQADENPTEL